MWSFAGGLNKAFRAYLAANSNITSCTFFVFVHVELLEFIGRADGFWHGPQNSSIDTLLFSGFAVSEIAIPCGLFAKIECETQIVADTLYSSIK